MNTTWERKGLQLNSIKECCRTSYNAWNCAQQQEFFEFNIAITLSWERKLPWALFLFLKTNNTFLSSLLYHLPSLTYQYTQMYTYTQWYLNSSFLLQLSHCITDFPNSNSLLSDFPKANPQLLVILMYSIFRMMLIFSFFFN
jgi:hypothetical protein